MSMPRPHCTQARGQIQEASARHESFEGGRTRNRTSTAPELDVQGVPWWGSGPHRASSGV